MFLKCQHAKIELFDLESRLNEKKDESLIYFFVFFIDIKSAISEHKKMFDHDLLYQVKVGDNYCWAKHRIKSFNDVFAFAHSS